MTNHTNFLEKYGILYQFGFKKGYFTEQDMLEIADSLKKAMDKKIGHRKLNCIGLLSAAFMFPQIPPTFSGLLTRFPKCTNFNCPVWNHILFILSDI